MPLIRSLHVPSGRIAAAALAFVVLAGLGAPTDRVQGDVQRIMYVHVPSAWIAYLAFLVTFAASLVVLHARGRRGSGQRADRIAVSSAEIGLLFTGIAIVSGSIWGRATWGVWWDWDPRLTTTAVLFVIYAAYLLLRSAIPDPDRRARLAAVLGLIAFIDVPVVHFSVVWWRGLHQPPTVLQPGHPPIDHPMLAVLLLSVAAFTLVYAALLRDRVRLEAARDEADERLLMEATA